MKLACTYRLTTLPTLIWFEGGQVRQRIEGFLGREELRTTLQFLSSSAMQPIAVNRPPVSPYAPQV
ncbi:MAG: hypothetical protein Fur0025_41550 [Oscillatoriaceae cyanobacterium]